MTRTLLRLSALALLVFLLTVGCNLSRPAATPGETSNSSVSTKAATGGLAIQITSPAADAQVPEGSPVRVEFSASGGPLIEIDLSVDGSPVATSVPPDTQAQFNGAIQWDKPIAGVHVLQVTVLDGSKNIATAQVRIQVGALKDETTPTNGPVTAGGMQLRLLNLSDGGSIAVSTDQNGKPFIPVKFEVSGSAPFSVTMTANGMLVPGEAKNDARVLPFIAELKWYPLNGGGSYDVVVSAIDDQKQTAQVSAHLTVTGIPAFTATPPPLDEAGARKRFAELFRQLYQIDIPAPAMQRFDFPASPNYSRWISSIYYKGERYYIDLYDDTHYDASALSYADPIHRSSQNGYILCRPAGNYKILVVFVDYGNAGANKADVLAQVGPITAWTNQLYDDYAHTQGFTTSPLHIQADGVYLSPPPAPGQMLTTAQILAATGVDPAKYDIVMQIDLDANNTTGNAQTKGLIEKEGGLALQGCGPRTKFDINIWSVVPSADEVQGGLIMDFNHELSHLFGMLDNWPFNPGGAITPDGQRHDDWITYAMFGWADSDGDGLPEILDPTPYGTQGPQP